MPDEAAAAAGTRASALPAKPPRRSTIFPRVLSTLEGSGAGFPACSPALPETQPLTGAARSGSTSTSTNQSFGTSSHTQKLTLTPGVERPISSEVHGPESSLTKGPEDGADAGNPTAPSSTVARRSSGSSSTSFHSPSARGRGCRTGPSVPTPYRG